MSDTGSARRRPSGRTRRYLPWLFVPIALLAADALRPPEKQVSARLAIAGIDLYQTTLSPLVGKAGVVCRFEEPTCSHYGEEAIRRHGIVRGSLLAAKRVARCGPWTEVGTVDPVPEVVNGES